MTRARLGIAVIGAGLIGRAHIERVLQSPDLHLASIVDPSPAARTEAHRLGVHCFTDIEVLLAAGKPDAAIVATPNQLHHLHALALIEAGVPCLVEKPLADTLAHAQAIVEAAEARGIPVATGHHRRHNPLTQRAKEIVDSGRLGRLVTVHAFFWLLKPDSYFDAAWRRRSGAGPVLTNLIHDVDLLRWWIGEIVEARGFQSNRIRGYPVDETCAVAVRFDNGVLGTLNISDTTIAPWSWEHTTGENPVYPATDQTCYHLAGTRGALAFPRLETWSNAVPHGWHQPFMSERLTAPRADALALQLAQFARVVRGEEAPLVSAREGLATLAAIDLVQRAMGPLPQAAAP